MNDILENIQDCMKDSRILIQSEIANIKDGACIGDMMAFMDEQRYPYEQFTNLPDDEAHQGICVCFNQALFLAIHVELQVLDKMVEITTIR